MLFGVFIATTSSIFIAAPILMLLGTWWERTHKRGLGDTDTTVTAK
jgi:SecD/SecF fusion protein